MALNIIALLKRNYGKILWLGIGFVLCLMVFALVPASRQLTPRMVHGIATSNRLFVIGFVLLVASTIFVARRRKSIAGTFASAFLAGFMVAMSAIAFTGSVYYGRFFGNVRNVINVTTDFLAVGDGVTDDSVPIQSAIYYATCSNGTPNRVYIPAYPAGVGTTLTQTVYQCSNTLILPVLTNGSFQVGDSGTKPIQIIGDGQTQSILRFPALVNTNGIQFLIHPGIEQNNYRFLNNFRLADLGIWGPGWTNIWQEAAGSTLDNVNVTADGIMLGFDPSIAYFNTIGWNDIIERCNIEGWRNGVIITNTVAMTIRECTMKYNWKSAFTLSGCDTYKVERNIILGSQNTSTNSLAAIALFVQNGGNGGRGGTINDNEIGGFATAVYANGVGAVTMLNGNFERCNAITVQSNSAAIVSINLHILPNITGTNYTGGTGQGALFVYGDNVASALSICINPQVNQGAVGGWITNSQVANSQCTNYFCGYGVGAFVPPTFYGIPVYGGSYFYGKYNSVNAVATASVGNSGGNVWTGLNTYQNGNVFPAGGTMFVGADYGAVTLTAGTRKAFEIDAPPDNTTTYNYSILSYDANGGARVLYIGESSFGGAEVDYLRLGGGSAGNYVQYHASVLSIGGNTSGALTTSQGNKASLITSNIVVSPYLWTNTFGYNCEVFISGAGGGSNSVAVNGTFIGYMTNGCSFIVQPNETVWNTNGAAHPNFSIKPF